jgi:hypothetical protein
MSWTWTEAASLLKVQRCLDNAGRCDKLSIAARDPIAKTMFAEAACDWCVLARQRDGLHRDGDWRGA